MDNFTMDDYSSDSIPRDSSWKNGLSEEEINQLEPNLNNYVKI